MSSPAPRQTSRQSLWSAHAAHALALWPGVANAQVVDARRHPVGTEGTSSSSRDAATVHQEAEEAADESHTLMSEQEKEILHKLQKNFPSSTIAVQDVSGGSRSLSFMLFGRGEKRADAGSSRRMRYLLRHLGRKRQVQGLEQDQAAPARQQGARGGGQDLAWDAGEDVLFPDLSGRPYAESEPHPSQLKTQALQA